MYRRQIYGGREADEFRPNRDLFEEHLLDNQIAEGEEVKALRELVKSSMKDPNDVGKKKAVENFLQELKEKGFSNKRTESMLVRAMAGVSIPDLKKITPQPSARALRRRARKAGGA